MMATPFFPALRAQLAAQGQRTVQTLRRLDFPPLLQQIRQLLPPELLTRAAAGPNSRERIFSLGLTLECFLWQMLKPRTACREVCKCQFSLLQLVDRGGVFGQNPLMPRQIRREFAGAIYHVLKSSPNFSTRLTRLSD